jgi:hypothetical protein
MFVIKVGTVSAMLFTLVVMLLGKTVAGKHIRQAVAYDPVATGTVDHLAHSLSDGKESDRLLQYTAITSCDVPGEVANLGVWINGICYDDLVTCCIPIITYNTCDEGYYPYLENWKNGACSSSDKTDCCVTYVTSCDEPGEGRIQANFDWDEVNKYWYCYPGISECCGPLQKISTILCNGALPLQYPEYWNDGVCSVAVESGSAAVQSDCCYNENGNDVYAFESCYESQEQIPGKWNSNGFCVASYLSDCCSGNGGSTSKGSESSSGGLIIGIVVALLIVAVLVTLISCARCPSCPWYSKMHCSPKNHPVPTTNTVASSNAPTKEQVVDTEDRSVTEVPPETAAPGSNGAPPDAPTQMERISGLWTTAKKAYHRAADVVDTVEKFTTSVNNVTQFVETVQDGLEEEEEEPEEEEEEEVVPEDEVELGVKLEC